ncbi:MAG: molybdopterin molybdotransferase MoeA, partial [Desulfomonile sp.]|nr:molybdopterin molybdotransferase MoeA [Desulfomonile sp.]
MEKPFLRVMSADQAREFLRIFGPLSTEEVSLEDALFRVLSQPITAPEDIPGFNRSTMDGFAVRAADTFGASESSPALFRVVGEVLMGEIRDVTVKRGDAVRIWTGGALPVECDAVVMVEHTEQHDDVTLEVLKAVAPFENVVRKGEDFRQGETLLSPGSRLRPQDLGLLAAMGCLSVRVYKKPTVAVISSGDEICPVDQTPPPGCVRDINRYTLSAMISEAFARPVWVGIAVDELEAISGAIERGVREADAVVISGGSSMGSRDLVIEAVQRSAGGQVLFHGVNVSPGKPLILASAALKPVFGLPGHPVSAMVCLEQFVVPLIRRLEGENTLMPFLRPTVEAVLSRNVPS